MLDIGLIGFLITWAGAASAYAMVLMRRIELLRARPLLAIKSLSAPDSELDLVIENAGAGAAVRARIAVRGQFNGTRLYEVDALGGGKEVELKSISPRSEWVQITLEYTDIEGRPFREKRQLQAVGDGPYRLIDTGEPKPGKLRLVRLPPP
jgi:hypothetical protein